MLYGSTSYGSTFYVINEEPFLVESIHVFATAAGDIRI